MIPATEIGGCAQESGWKAGLHSNYIHVNNILWEDGLMPFQDCICFQMGTNRKFIDRFTPQERMKMRSFLSRLES